ncbi:MAG: JAB domain-containing protein [Chitinophagales bacterium]|nr:JAB domain-containing protein [Chitinophagales bacterium]
MCYKIPYEVTEIKLIYETKIRAKDRPQVTSSQDAYEILLANWSEQIGFIEEFYILLLDRSNRVMGHYRVSQGSMAGTIVDPKVVFAAALKTRSSALILAHNHPSGTLRPSPADKALTQTLQQAGELLDMPILDHLILSPEGGFFSFVDEGLL